MTKTIEIEDPEVLEILAFFDPPPGDFSDRCLEWGDLLAALERSAQLRTGILVLTPADGRTGWSTRHAQDMARSVEACLAAAAALAELQP